MSGHSGQFNPRDWQRYSSLNVISHEVHVKMTVVYHVVLRNTAFPPQYICRLTYYVCLFIPVRILYNHFVYVKHVSVFNTALLAL